MMRPHAAARATAEFFTSRAGMFVVLAFLLATQNTYASTLAASLFLSRLGAGAIPVYYLLFAVVSIPCSAVISTVIDRFPRPVILKFMLSLFVVITLTMSALLGLGEGWFYVVYLGISVCEQLLYSIFYVLFADYFTVIEAKRVTGRVTIGMALGGLAGGAGVALVTSFAGPRFALPLTPVLVGLVVAYFGWLTRRHRSLANVEPAAEESLTESLRVVPRLLWRYPMVALLAGAMFLNVLLQCLSEYLAFSIYAVHYPNVDQLASFLGMVHAGLNLLGFAIVIMFTDPLLTRLGVATMNRIYPALNTLSFGVLTVSSSLPAGILANIAYDPFVHSIDVPVATMNYNAIRHRLVGRVRVFVDGVVYPLGLAVAGVLLVVFQRGLDLHGIAAVGVAISLLLVWLHWNIGKHYVRGLLDMLRDGALDFDIDKSPLRLPSESVAEVRTMLAADPRTAYAGLQIVLRCDHEFPADEIGSALAVIPIMQARPLMEGLARTATPARIDTLGQLARSGSAAIRQLALEGLAHTGETLAVDRSLLTDSDEGLRAVTAAAVLAAAPGDPAALAVLREPLQPNAALGAIAVLRSRASDTAVGVLMAMGQHPDAAVRAAALGAAAAMSTYSSEILAWAKQSSLDTAPVVREAAFAVLIRAAPVEQLDAVMEAGLGDRAFQVRQAVIAALDTRGTGAVPGLYRQLNSNNEEAQLAAIEALGRIQGAGAEEGLYRMFETNVFPAIELHRQLTQLFQPGRPGWAAMSFALDNTRERALRLMMHALEALGHRKVLNLVRTMLNVSDERARANAIESLASLPQRRFVVPLSSLFEDDVGPHDGDAFNVARAKDVLRLAQASSDEALRAATAIAWHAETGDIPAGALNDPSELVAGTVHGLKHRTDLACPYQQEAPMNRLAFLHSVPLFADATLDDLIVIDRTLSCETYVDGERIVTEGDPGDRLCIVYRGEVVVRKRMPDGERELARLSASDFFGEMSLFDDEPRSATVAAVNEVEVLVLNRDRFHSLVHQRPSILIELCTTLVRRLRKAVG